MLLASVADIRDELGFDDMTDINAAITGALHAAEPRLAAVIGTEFGAVSDAEDLFYVHEPGFEQGLHVQTEFRLRRGFVTAVSSAVYDSDYAFSAPVDIEDYLLRAETGIVVDYRTNYDALYVKFVYDAGFAADGGDPDSYDLNEVPSWLQEAAKIQTLITLETHPSLEGAGVKQDTRALRHQLDAILRPHVRYAPVALSPI